MIENVYANTVSKKRRKEMSLEIYKWVSKSS